MRKLLEWVGAGLALGGVAGVLRELTDGWFGLLGFTRLLTENVGLLHGYEIHANVAIAALGASIAAAAGRLGRAAA
ncbi:hypothetical protein I3F58_25325 [Streptomyces sp. MUM 203J]|uniref:hypothetical protein n=1 Tax=Streptomyces sp. MUM 203J TaxID=2791990 RepID=UPI001F03D7EF|nr:hypothetical protein [Streptomyces sp. MUM 203J]MCH0542822.1 hypothetical protein [Streptomyces sp. MUM 203J]